MIIALLCRATGAWVFTQICHHHWLDATYVKARANGRVSGQAVVIAIGLNAVTGQREVLGLDVGPSEEGAFWQQFMPWWECEQLALEDANTDCVVRKPLSLPAAESVGSVRSHLYALDDALHLRYHLD